MKKTIPLGLLVAGLMVTGCSRYESATFESNRKGYSKAAKYYAKYLQKHNDPKAMLRLADSYREMRDYAKAEYWYAKAINMPEAQVADKLAYAMVLKANGKYSDAKAWFGKYLTQMPNDGTVRAMMASCDTAHSYSSTADQYNVTPLGSNSDGSNFAMTQYEDGYVFCTEAADNRKKINPWNGRPYLHIVYSKINNDGKMGEPQPFAESINTSYHNGPVAFSPKYDKIYFTQSNTKNNNKLKKTTNGINNVKLYTASRNGNDWTDVSELPFNSNEYSSGQPALSSDGKILFFVSDRPGGKGKTDLYISRNINGNWSEPVNLGSQINTTGNEMFPTYFKTPEGVSRLYFSSDGREGLGGLDLYYSEQRIDGSWSAPIHMAAPFNSPKDDFGIIMKNNQSGYFSSSRNGNGDLDQLYAFDKVIPVNLFAEGVVIDRNTMKPVSNTEIVIANKTTGKNEIMNTKDGKFFLPLEKNSDYAFGANHEHYLPSTFVASTVGKTVSETLKVQVFLDSVDYVLSLTNVYYDFDKWNIREDATAQLDKLVEILKEHPEVILALDAHADTKGTQSYNMALTKKRAESVIGYLVERGVDRKRFLAKWHGKDKPATEDPKGMHDPEIDQKNRRTEFKMVNEKGEVVTVYAPIRYTSR